VEKTLSKRSLAKVGSQERAVSPLPVGVGHDDGLPADLHLDLHHHRLLGLATNKDYLSAGRDCTHRARSSSHS
jgi:hypothetical protein